MLMEVHQLLEFEAWFMTDICNLYVFSLVEDSPRGVRDCRDPSLGLEELLNQRAQDLKGREESLVNSFTYLFKQLFYPFLSPVLLYSHIHFQIK